MIDLTFDLLTIKGEFEFIKEANSVLPGFNSSLFNVAALSLLRKIP